MQLYIIKGDIVIASGDAEKVKQIENILTSYFGATGYYCSRHSGAYTALSGAYTALSIDFQGEASESWPEEILKKAQNIAPVAKFELEFAANCPGARFSLDTDANSLTTDYGEVTFSGTANAVRAWYAVRCAFSHRDLVSLLVRELGCSREKAEEIAIA